MRSRRSRFALALVAFVLGLMVVIQLRAQSAGGGLNALSTQDLTTLIANLNARNGQLRDEVTALQGQLRQLTTAQNAGRSNVGELQAELQRLRLWAGLDAVRGRGITVSFSGPIGPEAVNDVLNELRIAGAEALAVDDIRVVPGVVATGAPGSLSVSGHSLADPFTLTAIGNPANLQAILQRAGGIVSRIAVAQPTVTVEVTPSDRPLTVSGTTRNLLPAHGQPRV